MADTFHIIKQRFAKGLREAPFEFVAPLIGIARSSPIVVRIVARQVHRAMTEARDKAGRGNAQK